MTKFRKTRVTKDVGSPGKFVAQYWDPDMRLWFDIGDPKDSRAEAEAHLAAELAANRTRANERESR